MADLPEPLGRQRGETGEPGAPVCGTQENGVERTDRF